MENEQISKIRQAVRDAEHPLAQQLVSQVVTLLGHDEVVYIDGTHQVSGEWTRWTDVVLTADRVIHATSNIRGGVTRSAPQCMTWARRDLISATIIERKVHEDSSSVNEDEWPRGSRLSLQYAGGDRPLELPLRDDERTRRRFRQLVPSLLADLAR